MVARTRGFCHYVRPMETDRLGPANFQVSNHQEENDDAIKAQFRLATTS
jgi:hypothetical protein